MLQRGATGHDLCFTCQPHKNAKNAKGGIDDIVGNAAFGHKLPAKLPR